MKTSLFDYDLPKDMIAQHPPKDRGATKLLILDRQTGEISHRLYSDIPDFINKDDVIVLNRTKVMKARLYPTVKRTGRQIELFFLKKVSGKDQEIWECLIGGARYVKIGDELVINDELMKVHNRQKGEKTFQIKVKNAEEIMKKYGNVPLPPYIKREPNSEDEERYNTIFSESVGSVAAPTASLNLTESMISEITSKGSEICYVDLNVGLGTFAPVTSENIEGHDMHSEYISISKNTADTVNNCKGRIWAFGTTVVRTLESAAIGSKEIEEYAGETELFIYPGYKFKIVEVLVTNFHMPRSSLLMLVSAFADRKNISKAYEEAKREGYSFLSYGDSMLIGDFLGKFE